MCVVGVVDVGVDFVVGVVGSGLVVVVEGVVARDVVGVVVFVAVVRWPCCGCWLGLVVVVVGGGVAVVVVSCCVVASAAVGVAIVVVVARR